MTTETTTTEEHVTETVVPEQLPPQEPPPQEPAPQEPEPEPELVGPAAPIDLPAPKQWAQVQLDGPDVTGFFLQVEAPADDDRHRYVLIEPAFSSTDAPRGTPTEVLRYRGGSALVWEETAPLGDMQDYAINQIDSAADRVRQGIVSKQTNTEEYKRAEAQARAFAAAGYPEDGAPSCVAAWADAKRRDGWTARTAADDIIATADRWYALLDAIRALRLIAKEDVRHAVNTATITARVAQFHSDLMALVTGASASDTEPPNN